MYKHLYDSFKHWFHNKNETESNPVFFLSDPHFGDKEMKQVRKNNISDEEFIKRINKTVGKTSTLVILGDVGDVEWVKKIRAGRKVLIMGNHDKGASNYKRMFIGKDVASELKELKFKIWENIAKASPDDGYGGVPLKLLGYDSLDDMRNKIYDENMEYDNKLFDEVYEGVLMISDKIILSHEPVNFEYAFNIHGHDHANWFKGKQHLNVCAEHIDYTPISLNQIVKSGMLSNVPNVHRTTIDKAVERKGKKKGNK